MLFKDFVVYLEKLESISSTLESTRVLADLIGKLKPDEVKNALYLSLGILGPAYDTVQFNMSDKLIIRALSVPFGLEEGKIKSEMRRIGDLGDVAATLDGRKKSSSLSINEVFSKLKYIALLKGVGSVDQKIQTTSELLASLSGLERKYSIRIILERLRMGFAEATLMDALSWQLVGDKSLRTKIEAAFNVLPDIGQVGELLLKKGIDDLQKVTITPGVPIRPAKSERLASPEKIIEKLGEFALEPKIDGFRAQIHVWEEKGKKQVKIFSRNLNETTDMFPDIVDAAKRAPIKSGIFDAEAVAYDLETGEFLTFQDTVKRRRKHGVEEMTAEVPLRAFIFDILYLNGEELLQRPGNERFELLNKINFSQATVEKGKDLFSSTKESTAIYPLTVTEHTIVNSLDEFRRLFDLYISKGLEGVMCKKNDAVYQAGARNFNWVKYKRASEKELTDTVDAVIMGYYSGQGQRARFGIGAFLIGVIDEETKQYKTIAKVGTGLKDNDWIELKKRLNKFIAKTKPSFYHVVNQLTPDYWVDPKIVVEIAADEITRSPVHTAAQQEAKGTGLALRFPRFVRYIDDKDASDVTSTKELVDLYKLQKVGK